MASQKHILGTEDKKKENASLNISYGFFDHIYVVRSMYCRVFFKFLYKLFFNVTVKHIFKSLVTDKRNSIMISLDTPAVLNLEAASDYFIGGNYLLSSFNR